MNSIVAASGDVLENVTKTSDVGIPSLENAFSYITRASGLTSGGGVFLNVFATVHPSWTMEVATIIQNKRNKDMVFIRLLTTSSFRDSMHTESKVLSIF